MMYLHIKLLINVFFPTFFGLFGFVFFLHHFPEIMVAKLYTIYLLFDVLLVILLASQTVFGYVIGLVISDIELYTICTYSILSPCWLLFSLGTVVQY